MIILDIHLQNFRNHADSLLRFGDGINLLLGANGQGKTNVLEAVSYLGLTKSFYASSDLHVLRVGEPSFSLHGHLQSDGGVPHAVEITFDGTAPQKSVLIDHSAPATMSSVIGRFPVVILSPEHHRITSGSPAERRRFLDLLLSQVSALYLEDIMQYRKVLRQRNRLLHDARWRSGPIEDLLEPWTMNLAQLGARVTVRRRDFVREFAEYVRRTYAFLAGEREEPSIEYCAAEEGTEAESVDEIAHKLREMMKDRWEDELRRGATMVGPHRDELKLTLNGLSVQQFASQGQQKTFLVSLKMAEQSYLRERRNEQPIMLLDDLFGELDADRCGRILKRLEEDGQCVITATDEHAFARAKSLPGACKRFMVDRGTVKEAA